MNIYQSRSFGRTIKRLHKQDKEIIDREIRDIADKPRAAEEKKGDLRGIYVRKFKIKTTEYLLAYQIVGEDLELIMVGSHENYYRDLKKYRRGK